MGQGILFPFCSRPPGRPAATGRSWCSQQLQACGVKAGPRAGKGVPSSPPTSNPSCCCKRVSPPQVTAVARTEEQGPGQGAVCTLSYCHFSLEQLLGKKVPPCCVPGAEPALSSHNHGLGSPDNPSLLWDQPKITEALFGISISDQGQTLL